MRYGAPIGKVADFTFIEPLEAPADQKENEDGHGRNYHLDVAGDRLVRSRYLVCEAAGKTRTLTIMAKPKTKSIQIGIDLHAALTAIASERSAAGRRVTLRDVVEEIICRGQPDLLEVAGIVIDVPTDDGSKAAEYQAILAAAFGGGPVAGRLAGHFGQPISRQELADYMRISMPTVSDLDGLLRAFEQAVRP